MVDKARKTTCCNNIAGADVLFFLRELESNSMYFEHIYIRSTISQLSRTQRFEHRGLQDVSVVDPSGAWLSHLAKRTAMHQTKLLRSTITQVPFVNVLVIIIINMLKSRRLLCGQGYE
jgi:hypothetical protein